MEKPNILGVEVMTPDGQGSVLSLHNKKVVVLLNVIHHNQIMKGLRRDTMQYAYDYKDVEVMRGCFLFDKNQVNHFYSQ